jgi:hypothetical protein
MEWSQPMRQVHRWTSLVFTIAVGVNIVLNLVAPEQVAMVVGGLTLLPLFVLLLTGIYLFVLPYRVRRRPAT